MGWWRTGREYPDRPLAAVGAIILTEGRVLLIKRQYEPSRGKWSIPGGLVELGEPVREALRREVAEEVGLEVEVGDLVDVVDNIVRDPDGRVRYHYILLDFLAYPRGGELKVNQEVEDVGWFTPDEVEGLETTRTAKRLLRKIGFLPSEEGEKG